MKIFNTNLNTGELVIVQVMKYGRSMLYTTLLHNQQGEMIHKSEKSEHNIDMSEKEFYTQRLLPMLKG